MTPTKEQGFQSSSGSLESKIHHFRVNTKGINKGFPSDKGRPNTRYKMAKNNDENGIALTKIFSADLAFIHENMKDRETQKDTIKRLLKELRKHRRG